MSLLSYDKVQAFNAPARGTQKENVHKATLRVDYGVEGDAHAGNWHRQVSLLSYDKVQAFNARGAAVKDGALWRVTHMQATGTVR